MKFGTGNVHKNVLGDCGFLEGHKRYYIYAFSATFGGKERLTSLYYVTLSATSVRVISRSDKDLVSHFRLAANTQPRLHTMSVPYVPPSPTL